TTQQRRSVESSRAMPTMRRASCMRCSTDSSIVPADLRTRRTRLSPDYSALQDTLDRGNMLREGHFVFRSGVHATALIDRDLLLADPGTASRFGYTIAKAFFTEHVDTVATPSIWGAGL